MKHVRLIGKAKLKQLPQTATLMSFKSKKKPAINATMTL